MNIDCRLVWGIQLLSSQNSCTSTTGWYEVYNYYLLKIHEHRLQAGMRYTIIIFSKLMNIDCRLVWGIQLLSSQNSWTSTAGWYEVHNYYLLKTHKHRLQAGMRYTIIIFSKFMHIDYRLVWGIQLLSSQNSWASTAGWYEVYNYYLLKIHAHRLQTGMRYTIIIFSKFMNIDCRLVWGIQLFSSQNSWTSTAGWYEVYNYYLLKIHAHWLQAGMRYTSHVDAQLES